MDKKGTPRNEQGERPTRSPEETVERLDQKKKQDHGTANKARIEEQEREVRSGR